MRFDHLRGGIWKGERYQGENVKEKEESELKRG
jgi:hypothetical protein